MKGIIVMSGKGGCGKDVISINIANELSRTHKVAILDVDIESANIPSLFNNTRRLRQTLDGRFIPSKWGKIKFISTAMFDSDISVISKSGDENRQIVHDLIMHTSWGETEILIINVPGGLGDELHAVLDSMHDHSILGVVAVTLPSTVEDLHRVIELCSRIGLRIFGVIENIHEAVCECGGEIVCKKCGVVFMPFEESNVKLQDTIEKFKVEFLGSIPLVGGTQKRVNAGKGPILPPRYREPIKAAVKMIKEAAGE